MKKIFTLMTVALAMGGTIYAQDEATEEAQYLFEDFEGYEIGTAIANRYDPNCENVDDYYVCVAQDPLNEDGKALWIRYNPANDGDRYLIPAIKVTLAEGETVADITEFAFNIYAFQYAGNNDYNKDFVDQYLEEHEELGFADDKFNNSSYTEFNYYIIPVQDDWADVAANYKKGSGKNSNDLNSGNKNSWNDASWEITAPEGTEDLSEFYFLFGPDQKQVYWFADNLTFKGVTGGVETIIGTIEMDNEGTVTGFYNLAGQKLTEAPAQGLYIKDGKKVIAK